MCFSRYKVLTDILILADGPVCVPKRVTTTRWSCKADATKALRRGYPYFKDALLTIAEDENNHGLFERMCQLETGIYAVFWDEILNRANATSHVLQDPKLDLNTAVAAIKSLKSFVEQKRVCVDA